MDKNAADPGVPKNAVDSGVPRNPAGPGVPVKVLKEFEGRMIVLECASGETYKGKLIEAEDNLTCQLDEVEVTLCNGRKMKLESVYVRGHNVRYVVLPEMPKKALMFQLRGASRGGGRRGRGRPGARRGGQSGRGRARGGQSGRGQSPGFTFTAPTATTSVPYYTPYMAPIPAPVPVPTAAPGPYAGAVGGYYALPGTYAPYGSYMGQYPHY